ncbi:MAG: hypothetical protein ACXAEX_01035 [Promethearchaeota archaeon]
MVEKVKKEINKLTVEDMIWAKYGDSADKIINELKKAWGEEGALSKKVHKLHKLLGKLDDLTPGSDKEWLEMTSLSFITIFPSPPD